MAGRISAFSWSGLTFNSEPYLKQYVDDTPIVVGVKFSSSVFKDYTGGILDDEQCNVGESDHTLLLVGYGNENGKDYWIARNR